MKKGGKRKIELKPITARQFPTGSIPTSVKPEDKSLFEKQPTLEEAEKKEISEGHPPRDWMGPKIYKGTSVS